MAAGDHAVRRNKASALEVQEWDRNVIQGTEALPPYYRPWQMFSAPTSVPGILYYDAEGMRTTQSASTCRARRKRTNRPW